MRMRADYVLRGSIPVEVPDGTPPSRARRIAAEAVADMTAFEMTANLHRREGAPVPVLEDVREGPHLDPFDILGSGRLMGTPTAVPLDDGCYEVTSLWRMPDGHRARMSSLFSEEDFGRADRLEHLPFADAENEVEEVRREDEHWSKK